MFGWRALERSVHCSGAPGSSLGMGRGVFAPSANPGRRRNQSGVRGSDRVQSWTRRLDGAVSLPRQSPGMDVSSQKSRRQRRMDLQRNGKLVLITLASAREFRRESRAARCPRPRRPPGAAPARAWRGRRAGLAPEARPAHQRRRRHRPPRPRRQGLGLPQGGRLERPALRPPGPAGDLRGRRTAA